VISGGETEDDMFLGRNDAVEDIVSAAVQLA